MSNTLTNLGTSEQLMVIEAKAEISEESLTVLAIK